MRTRLTILFLFVLAIHLRAQAPESFKYQAVLRDDKGKVIEDTQVGIEIAILQGGQSGTVVYRETFSPTTNSFGLINLNIGTGTVITGVFADIDWSVDTYFLRVGLDETGGTTYVNLGSTQLLSVPYALHAKTSADSFSGAYGDLTGIPAFATVATSGDYNDLSNRPTLATVATTGDFNDLLNIPSDLGGIPQHEWSGTSLRFENPDGSFGSFVDLQGPAGSDGADGNLIISGVTDPTTEGNDGDYYINTATSTLFGPKVAGSWPAGNSLVGATGPQGPAGPTGAQGPTGSTGADGLDGRTILTGLIDPTTQGNDGDIYINTATSTLFGPKTGGVWPGGISLIGAQGPQGVQGPQGLQGVAGPQGVQGVAGPAGAQGPQGEAGPAGPQGPAGIQGIQGEAGPQGPTGAQGADGPQGPTGATGADGLDGKTILNGIVDPTTEGTDGDFYLNTTTTTLFGPRAGGTWPAGVSLLNGPAGPQGTAGTNGADGLDGQDGQDGEDGKTILNGTTDPSTEGNDGDFYLNTSTSTLFGPKSGGVWPAGVSLLNGPAGPQGPEGPQGPAGAQGATGAQGTAGAAPGHEWNGTSLRFENPDGSFGSFVDLQGPAGAVGPAGVAGASPEYEWSGTQIRFRNPNGSWGSWVDLKGAKGDKGENELTSVTTYSFCYRNPEPSSNNRQNCDCSGGELLSQVRVRQGYCTANSDTGSCNVSSINSNDYSYCCVCR